MEHQPFTSNSWLIRIRNACLLFWYGLRDNLRACVEVNVGAHRFRFDQVLWNPVMRVYLTPRQLEILFSKQDRPGEIGYGGKVFTTAEIAALIDDVTAAQTIAGDGLPVCLECANTRSVLNEETGERIVCPRCYPAVLPEHLR